MSLKIATHLLTHPMAQARHCCVVDTGLAEADGGGGYDTHEEAPHTQARNFNNFVSSLLPRINLPGEGDPAKLDLDRTLIILNMEFGRAPGAQNSGQGRNHWPYGYVQVYFGGPVQKGIYGAIAEDGHASVVHHAVRESHRSAPRAGHLALRRAELQRERRQQRRR